MVTVSIDKSIEKQAKTDYGEEEEDIRDAKIADEAYEEYVKDGCKSRPMSELFKEVGIR
jgi:hypothetical protein